MVWYHFILYYYYYYCPFINQLIIEVSSLLVFVLSFAHFFLPEQVTLSVNYLSIYLSESWLFLSPLNWSSISCLSPQYHQEEWLQSLRRPSGAVVPQHRHESAKVITAFLSLYRPLTFCQGCMDSLISLQRIWRPLTVFIKYQRPPS